MKIGIAWSGFAGNPRDRYRSMRFADLAPLADISNAIFYRLQPGGVADSPHPALIDHTALLTDWAETAALLANLDLVISVDTAVAHLAGALARPTWTLLSAAPEWRWLIDRNDSPWYPTMRLFRQPTPGDWATPMGEVVAALRELAASTPP